MSDPSSKLIVVGVLSGAHGVRGDVRVKSFTEDPHALFHYGPLLNEAGEKLLDPKTYRVAKDHFIVTPRTARQKEEWDTLKGTRLFVPRSRLPDSEDDEFYIEDLVGLRVLDLNDNEIGRVKAVLDHGAGDLIEILPAGGTKPVLVPFTREDIPDLDLSEGKIVVATFDIWADQSGSPDEEA